MTELRRLEIDANSFVAGGNKYLIHSSISLGRINFFEKFRLMVSTGMAIKDVKAQLGEIINLENSGKKVQANHKLYLLNESLEIATVETTHPVFLLASLFICREEEDLSVWNEAKALENINDWIQEGFDYNDFFALAFSLAQDFLNASIKRLNDQGQADQEDL